MLIIENVHYDFLLLSIAKKFGLEASETIEFAEFVLTSDDHSAIQKNIKKFTKKY